MEDILSKQRDFFQQCYQVLEKKSEDRNLSKDLQPICEKFIIGILSQINEYKEVLFHTYDEQQLTNQIDQKRFFSNEFLGTKQQGKEKFISDIKENSHSIRDIEIQQIQVHVIESKDKIEFQESQDGELKNQIQLLEHNNLLLKQELQQQQINHSILLSQHHQLHQDLSQTNIKYLKLQTDFEQRIEQCSISNDKKLNDIQKKYQEYKEQGLLDKVKYRQQYENLKVKAQEKIHRLKEIIIEYQINLEQMELEMDRQKKVMLFAQEEKFNALNQKNQKSVSSQIGTDFDDPVQKKNIQSKLMIIVQSLQGLKQEHQQLLKSIKEYIDKFQFDISTLIVGNQQLLQPQIRNQMAQLVTDFHQKIYTLQRQIAVESTPICQWCKSPDDFGKTCKTEAKPKLQQNYSTSNLMTLKTEKISNNDNNQINSNTNNNSSKCKKNLIKDFDIVAQGWLHQKIFKK